MNDNELKPCPFCGGDAEMNTHQHYRAINFKLDTSVAIYCRSCSVTMALARLDNPDASTETLADVLVKTWNTRNFTDKVAA